MGDALGAAGLSSCALQGLRDQGRGSQRVMNSTTGERAPEEVLPTTQEAPEATPARPRSPSPASAAPSSVGVESLYGRFLELPVALVLVVMWLAGAALMGTCVLVMYLVASALT